MHILPVLLIFPEVSRMSNPEKHINMPCFTRELVTVGLSPYRLAVEEAEEFLLGVEGVFGPFLVGRSSRTSRGLG